MINYEINQELFIEKYFRLNSKSAKGWRQNLSGCPFCHDGKSKNPRSHFIFSNNEIGFHCFNCGAKNRFTNTNISALASFISKASWKKIGAVLLEIKKSKLFPEYNIKDQEDIKEIVDDNNLKLIDYKEIELPEVSISLNMKLSSVAPKYKKRFKKYKQLAKIYLHEHGIIDKKIINKLFICMDGDFSNRLIFPIYFDGKLISFTARALFPTKTKYLYPPTIDAFNDRGKIIYNLDKLLRNDNSKRIFITESIIDSWLLDGLAVLSKNITEEQIKILDTFNIFKKELIFVLDKDKINFKYNTDLKGIELGKAVLNAKNPLWKVSYPNFSNPTKDISESYAKFGFLETYDKIIEGIITNSTSLMLKARLGNLN